MWKVIAIVLLAVVLIVGCATIFKGTSQQIHLPFFLPNKACIKIADVYVDGVKVGQTPIVIKVNCNNEHTIELKKLDGTSKSFRTPQYLAFDWLILDILPYGLNCTVIAIIVDAVTGSWDYLGQNYLMKVDPIKLAEPVAGVGENPFAHRHIDLDLSR